MCGIFGLAIADMQGVTAKELKDVLTTLFKLSESRGKESAGISAIAFGSGSMFMAKSPLSASGFIRTGQLDRVLDAVVSKAFECGQGLAVIAHSRMVTNGSQYTNSNNQPVNSGAVALVHNGIVTNVDALWNAEPKLIRSSLVDSELLAARLSYAIEQQGKEIESATRQVFSDMEGAASIAALLPTCRSVVLATNTGSLYTSCTKTRNTMVFASEEFILNKLIGDRNLAERWGLPPATRLEPGTAKSLEYTKGKSETHDFSLGGTAISCDRKPNETPMSFSLVDFSDNSQIPPRVMIEYQSRELPYDETWISSLSRCSRCILPSTFPYIEFDSNGVCSYCRSYTSRSETLGADAFAEGIKKYRRNDSKPDCIVAFSGGRDSSYGLHVLKHQFGLNPITFTYDWGMVTDLARRNIARVCGKLGLENILVSADIASKRSNIKKNLEAWIGSPHLGLIPLLMAGDKYFFRYMNVIRKQTGISLNIWCTNNLENTEFKVGLCGIKPNFNKERIDSLSVSQKMRLALFYGSKILTNGGYLNSSLGDTLGAFWTYYFEQRSDYFLLFDYVRWEEKEVNETLIREYNWEVAPDSESTWRIGDGTAAFYNYCYLSVLGFSEFDTFLSNQVREGMMSRSEALKRVLVDNKPRSESLYWYLATVDLEPESTIRALNQKLNALKQLSNE